MPQFGVDHVAAITRTTVLVLAIYDRAKLCEYNLLSACLTRTSGSVSCSRVMRSLGPCALVSSALRRTHTCKQHVCV